VLVQLNVERVGWRSLIVVPDPLQIEPDTIEMPVRRVTPTKGKLFGIAELAACALNDTDVPPNVVRRSQMPRGC
jgi:hypothetical protein